MEFITPKSIEGLVTKMGFPKPGKYTQDWECEVADHTRVREWMSEYQRSDLNDEERFALVMIIVESMNDALLIESITNQDLIIFKRLLIDNYTLHRNTLGDWADWEQTDLTDSHAITPTIREIIVEAAG